MSYLSFADVMRPSTRRNVALYETTLVLGATLLLALSAQIAIPLPFSPVPITAQTMVVVLIGAAFGSRRSVLCLLAYLLEGLVGMPVFAGGNAGPVYMLGPTGGYLLGFVAAAFATGFLAERGWDRRLLTSLTAMLVGNATIYLFGLAWLSRFVGSERVLALGLLPFIPGDLLKLGLATLLLPISWKFLPPAIGAETPKE